MDLILQLYFYWIISSEQSQPWDKDRNIKIEEVVKGMERKGK